MSAEVSFLIAVGPVLSPQHIVGRLGNALVWSIADWSFARRASPASVEGPRDGFRVSLNYRRGRRTLAQTKNEDPSVH
jgi:hypothetical protein